MHEQTCVLQGRCQQNSVVVPQAAPTQADTLLVTQKQGPTCRRWRKHEPVG
jgi:hypothetical protein